MSEKNRPAVPDHSDDIETQELPADELERVAGGRGPGAKKKVSKKSTDFDYDLPILKKI